MKLQKQTTPLKTKNKLLTKNYEIISLSELSKLNLEVKKHFQVL